MMADKKSEAFAFQIRLMRREARTRTSDAALLRSIPEAHSDSAYLLELLGFELLLKACLRINGRVPDRTHKYTEDFGKLPPDVRGRVLESASERMTTVADYSELAALLETWGKNFIHLRYPYERYEGRTAEEYEAEGEKWVADGAKDEEAVFSYHPTELRGLIYGLEREVDHWLKKQPASAGD